MMRFLLYAELTSMSMLPVLSHFTRPTFWVFVKGLIIENVIYFRNYSLSGMYRTVIHKPSELTYEIIPYSDVSVSLVLSDLEKLKDEQLQETAGWLLSTLYIRN